MKNQYEPDWLIIGSNDEDGPSVTWRRFAYLSPSRRKIERAVRRSSIIGMEIKINKKSYTVTNQIGGTVRVEATR